MVRMLARFKTYANDKTYFIDMVLSQLRATDNPHDMIQYEDPITLVMELREWENTGVGEYI